MGGGWRRGGDARMHRRASREEARGDGCHETIAPRDVRSSLARARRLFPSISWLFPGASRASRNGDDRGRARHTGVARRTGRVFGAMSTSRRRYASKWLTLVLCQLVMLSSGTLYLFPVYSPALKRELDLTQEQVNFVGSAAHFGAFFSVFGGIFFDRFGSRATLTLGAALKFAGLTALAGTVSGWLPRSHGFAALCGYVYGTGCSTSLTAALGANYATFKDKNVHGRLVGLLLSFFGLSSGIFSLVYDVFFDEPVAFVRCLALFAGGADFAASFLVGHPKHIALPGDAIADVAAARVHKSGAFPGSSLGAGRRLRDASARFFGPADAETKLARGLSACAAVAVHVALTAALTQLTNGSPLVAFTCFAMTLALGAAQAWTLLSSSGQLWFRASEMLAADAAGGASRFDATREGVGPAALVFLPDFWLVFVALMLSLGSGLTVINNLSQMTAAFPSLREHSAATSTSLLKLLACANTLGRLASGVVSDRLAPRVDRVTFAVHLVAAMAAGQAILFVVPEMFPLAGLVFGVAIAGAAFGALFWAMPTLTVELFGARHFGAIRGIVGLSPAAGGYLLSTVFAGRTYAAAAGGGNDCDAGGACYRAAWGTNLALCGVATGLMWTLAKRRKRRRGKGGALHRVA